MKFYLIILSIIIQTLTCNVAYSSESPLTNIKDRCSNKWGSNYHMVEHCINTQVDSAVACGKYYKTYLFKYTDKSLDISKDPKAIIVLECMSKWKDVNFDTYNFRMVEHCINTQFSSYDRIKNIE